MKNNYLLYFSLFLAMLLVPATARSQTASSVDLDIANGSITITSTGYKIGDAGETAFTGNYVITQTNSGTATQNKINVEGGEHKITLKGVNISPASVSGENWATPAVGLNDQSTVTLALQGNNKLYGGDAPQGWGASALFVPSGATLVIEGEKEATLSAISGSGSKSTGAGIGGSAWGSCGKIEIHGGIISAQGGQGAAGIGVGSNSGLTGEVVISGGVVTASINSTSFSTGTNGTAVITGNISDKSGQDSWSCINIVDGNLLVYDNLPLQEKLVVLENQVLKINEGVSLTIQDKGELSNNGAIYNNGSISGTVTTGGTICNNGSISGTVTNSGTIYNAGTLPPGIAGTVIPVAGVTSDFLFVENGVRGVDFTIAEERNITVQTGTPLSFKTLFVSLNSRIVVKGGVTADITLDGCRIGKTGTDYDRVEIQGPPLEIKTGASAVVRLSKDNVLYGSLNQAAIRVPAGASLTIKGEGSLNAQGGLFAAAIGGGHDESAGTIRIESGTITANGGVTATDKQSGGAGIGGGGSSSSTTGYSHSKITITGGNITAAGGYRSSGIGSAGRTSAAKDAEIRIEGGYVKANGGGTSGGIAIGSRDYCGNIIISGGTIEASKIGRYSDGSGTVTVTGGSILCTESSAVFPLPNYPHLLTLDNVGNNVNSVSVDNTPYYIDQPHTTDTYAGHLYLYIPEGAQMVYVREGDAVIPYTIKWEESNPTLTATRGEALVLKNGNLTFEGDGRSYTHGLDNSLANVKLEEAGDTGSPAEGETAIPMNTLSVKVTNTESQTLYEETFPIELAQDGALPEIALKLYEVPAGTYNMTIRYGGDATYKPTASCMTTLTVNRGTLSPDDFEFITSFYKQYNGKEQTATVNGKKPGIGTPVLHYYKDGIEQRPIAAGTYTVKITVEENEFFNAVSEEIGGDGWEYTINPRTVNINQSVPAFINNGKIIWIKYELNDYYILPEDRNDDTRLSVAGSLAVGSDYGDGWYEIVNPSKEEGGLYLTGSQADNYIISFYSGYGVADQYTENAAGWVKVDNYPFTLKAPTFVVITDAVGENERDEILFTEDGIYTYYLKYYHYDVCERILRIDGTAPVAPSAPVSLTGTVATFTLSDAMSGIETYRVSEGGLAIAEYAREANAVADASSCVGALSLSYAYTGILNSTHTLDFEVTDLAGNTATSSVTFTLKTPYVPPVPSYYDIYLESSDSVRLSSGSTVVEEGYSFTFTAEVAEGYDPAALTVEYKRGRNGNWQALEAEGSGKYRIRSVYDDIYVRAAVRPSVDPTAMDRVEDGKSRIRTLGNRICITADRPVDMRVVSIEGRVVRAERLPAGYSEVGGMPDGIYIVLLSDGTRSKVVIR